MFAVAKLRGPSFCRLEMGLLTFVVGVVVLAASATDISRRGLFFCSGGRGKGGGQGGVGPLRGRMGLTEHLAGCSPFGGPLLL